MLVVGPNSTCDVCLESYTDGVNIPHVISCGHVFCHNCLRHLVQQKCPLCRTHFLPHEVRKLHVDRDPNVRSTVVDDSVDPTNSVPPADQEAQRLLNHIARIVKEGAKINEIRRVIDECRTYYKAQGDQYTPVRVSCLLLHNLAESQRKLSSQVEDLDRLCVERDEIRDRLTSDLEASELKFQDLEQTRQYEKETALATEKSLREHYDQMNQYWIRELMAVEQERDSLMQAWKQYRSPRCDRSRRLPELQYIDTEDPVKVKKVLDDDVNFHLSPLNEVAVPLASTLQGFRALSDESHDDDLKRKKKACLERVDESGPEIACPCPPIESIPIPIRSSPVQQTSAMSVSADHWSTALTGCKSRDDVVMDSHPPSPSRRVSPLLCQPSRAREVHTQDSWEFQPSNPASENTWELVSDGVSKLYDLLDTPRPHSSTSTSTVRPDIPRASTASLPRSAATLPVSRSSVPARPASATVQRGPSTHANDLHATLTERRPLVSASDAAMQLERERQEKERERRRQRDVSSAAGSGSGSGSGSSSSSAPSLLKDATNAPGPATNTHYVHVYRHKLGGDKMRAMQVVPGTACV